MFRQDESGGIMVIFALALPVLLAGVAGAVEVTRMTAYRERLNSATELACNQGAVYVAAQRKIDLLKNYTSDVKTIVDTNVTQKQLANVTVGTPVVSSTNVRVANSGTIAFYLGAFLPSSAAKFDVSRDCALPVDPGGVSETLFKESFEDNHSVAPNSWTVLKNWNGWETTNAGIEINGQQSLASNTMRDGNFFAELDSDCNTSANKGASNCQSNSGMSRSYPKMAAGDYQIKYYYIARHGYVNTAPYGKDPICSDQTKPKGSERGDFASKANSNPYIKAAENDGETFRIDVFIDKESDTPFKTANLVDSCIWADIWIERTINFTITKKDDYVISWKASGRQDTYGGLIDSLRICKGVCP